MDYYFGLDTSTWIRRHVKLVAQCHPHCFRLAFNGISLLGEKVRGEISWTRYARVILIKFCITVCIWIYFILMQYIIPVWRNFQIERSKIYKYIKNNTRRTWGWMYMNHEENIRHAAIKSALYNNKIQKILYQKSQLI